ncbi:Undecaprenyl-phosphate mannosyltransferase [Pseudobythopirellula maris]|uniref:Undecaprenyl-phosphate mannosyltransferase n=1 Tax=Pseudobythopirellula maris TaxID=2527991 RepID=A0A5C5ZS09_9BACT|nr:glycosyltransferase family 2 protein [Pseudobythopirellula maris]TWT89023.1 Undecaprenyl-phosphate mannosyltransferase [Pseudobythopirellula maris]
MPQPPYRLLTALPVYNEASHVDGVLDCVVRCADDVLVVDDGSSDGTSKLLERRKDVRVVTHNPNRGYGAALQTAFCYARKHGYDVIVTIDCDGQHEPALIRELADRCWNEQVDIVSGSRYLETSTSTGVAPPADRRRINQTITAELNERFGLGLTDAFCGFKAYRVPPLRQLRLEEEGYAMPLELWAEAAHHGLSVVEAAVPRIYLEEKRSFGGELDQAETRLAHYREVIDRAVDRTQTAAAVGVMAPDPCGAWVEQG